MTTKEMLRLMDKTFVEEQIEKYAWNLIYRGWKVKYKNIDYIEKGTVLTLMGLDLKKNESYVFLFYTSNRSHYKVYLSKHLIMKSDTHDILHIVPFKLIVDRGKEVRIKSIQNSSGTAAIYVLERKGTSIRKKIQPVPKQVEKDIEIKPSKIKSSPSKKYEDLTPRKMKVEPPRHREHLKRFGETMQKLKNKN
jgi:hypothetical protein